MRAGLFCALFLLSAACRAGEWLEVSSDHFVIYSDQKEKTVTSFAERLELFHSAMSYILAMPVKTASPANRVNIFVMTDKVEVQRLAKRSGDRYVAGIYMPRAGSSIALVPESSGASSEYSLKPETILLHEYAHHFMAGKTSRTFPLWFTEGFAEFFSSVRFGTASVWLGMPATHRAMELAYARPIPIRDLLGFGTRDGKKEISGSYYGRSWVLFHYLQFSPDRAGQLTRYQQRLAAGDTALSAAEAAFGDLDVLARDVEAYSAQRRLANLEIPRDRLPIGPIVVRKLRTGEAEILTTVIRSKVGVDEAQAQTVVADARRIAAKYPDDPAVLAALAAAEVDAGNSDAAIVAADRALALDPARANAHIQKGFALGRKAQASAPPRTAWKDVREQWVRTNKVENDNPIPLVQYYLTFLNEGIKPTQTAIDGLQWAMLLAPFDADIRWQVANQMIADGRLALAMETLAPLAYSPHPGDRTDAALKLLQEIEERMGGQQAGIAPQPAAPAAN